MLNLIEGTHHFRDNIFRSQQELFSRLAEGQEPDVLFVTCSDSRIVPNLMTQTDPGELFILRNAGNLVPPHGAIRGGEEATIEYAVAVLGVEDIIVCGHSQCGAMKALLEPVETLHELPAVRRWLEHAEATRRIVKRNYTHLQGNDLLAATVQENVLVQLENLQTHPAVAAELARGTLKLHAWVYELETGAVLAFEPQTRKFEPLSAKHADRAGQIPQYEAVVGARWI